MSVTLLSASALGSTIATWAGLMQDVIPGVVGRYQHAFLWGGECQAEFRASESPDGRKGVTSRFYHGPRAPAVGGERRHAPEEVSDAGDRRKSG